MATIGLDKLYYAKITEDDAGAETYGTPTQLAKAMTADLSVELNEATPVSYTHLDVYKRQVYYLEMTGYILGMTVIYRHNQERRARVAGGNLCRRQKRRPTRRGDHHHDYTLQILRAHQPQRNGHIDKHQT